MQKSPHPKFWGNIGPTVLAWEGSRFKANCTTHRNFHSNRSTFLATDKLSRTGRQTDGLAVRLRHAYTHIQTDRRTDIRQAKNQIFMEFVLVETRNSITQFRIFDGVPILNSTRSANVEVKMGYYEVLPRRLGEEFREEYGRSPSRLIIRGSW